MKNQSSTLPSSGLPGLLLTPIIAGFLSFFLWCLALQSSYAGSATWNLNPTNGDWNTAANWTAGGPPNGSADSATFAASTSTNVSLSQLTEVNSIVYSADASAFTITVPVGFTLTLSGTGITNNSGIDQTFVTVNSLGNTNGIQFHNSATAGTGTVYINNAPQFFPDHGGIEFFDTSSAGSGVFTNTAAADEFNGGVMNFYNSSTAGNSTITNSGFPTFNHNHARTDFSDTSTAGNATIITNSGSTSTADNGDTEFFDTSSAGNATLIANGGPGQVATISFNQRSTGGTARVELLGGILDVSSHMSGVLTIGSLEGNGVAYLGTLNPAVNLTVGANNLSTTFSGLLSKGTRFGGDGGAFTKTGRGTLTLTGANTYTAGTTVNAGTLVVSNTTGTGTGPVVVTGGTLAGNGIIAGAVTIGGNNTMAAILSPAGKKQATLTLQSTLTFAISSTYTCSYRGNSRKVQFDQVVANGVTINDGAGFNFPGQTQGSLRIGTVLTVINNTSATPIAGTFNNLADGAIISANGGNFQASYEGGDGNDLTLTVVP